MLGETSAAKGRGAALGWRVANALQHAQARLAAIALVAMMLVTVADVVLRYLFNSPVHGSYEIVEATLVVFVFFGIAAGFFRRANIVIDVIDHLAGPRLVSALKWVADLLSLIVLVVLAWAMIGQAVQAYEYGDRKLELSLPIYILWVFALAGMAGTIVCAAAALIWRAPHPESGDSVVRE